MFGVGPGFFQQQATTPVNFIALPLTYDEMDYAGTMTWTRQGNGPHVTPQGFEGDGYEARLKSTTIPTWMQPASSVFTMHASISFYPQQLGATSSMALYAGENDTSPFAKINLSVIPDAVNPGITELALLAGTGGTGFVQKNMGRSFWKYQFRCPDDSIAGKFSRMQSIVFLDDDTVLVSAHFEDTIGRFYKVRLSDAVVLGQFDATGDWVHIGVTAFRSNGDLWALALSGKGCRIDLANSLATGSLVTLDVVQFSGFSAGAIMGAIGFVTVSGTEYVVMPEYLTSGSPYFYVFPASVLGTVTLTPADRYKRFASSPLEIQGICMRSGKLLTSSINPWTGTSNRYGYIYQTDIVTAISSTADGGSITYEAQWDNATKYAEDIAIHPTTNDVWALSEGITSVGSDLGGSSVWSNALDGSLAVNHYTAEYDGSSTIKIKINNRLYDTVSATLGIDVAVVSVGGPPQATAGYANKFFSGYVANVVLQDQPMTTAQYNTAVAGTTYEPNTLTAYEFTLTNPGAESSTSPTGWTSETGGLGVYTYPAFAIPAHSGVRFFYGGTVASTIARQRLDVLAQTGLTGTQIDAGGIWAKLRWWQCSFNSSTDPGGMGLRTLTAANATIVEAYSGIVWTPNADGSSYYPWYPRAFSAALGSGTRNLDALQRMTRTSGTSNDAYVDDIRVTVYRQ